MPVKDDILDLALPALLLELGELLSARGSLRCPSPRQTSARPPVEQGDAFADSLLDKVSKDATARKLVGIRRGMAKDSARIRLKAVAILGWQALRLSAEPLDIGDLSSAVADPKQPPAESLLRTRHEIGTMVAEDALIGSGETDGPIRKARLPVRTLEWLSGGRKSMGTLTQNKLLGMILPKGFEDETPPPETTTIPTVKELQAKIGEKVIGLDEQAKSLSALLIMHLARAKLLKAGTDSGSGNQAVLLAGNSGCGKTWLMEVAAKAIGCPFGSMSATAMTGEAYIGGKIDDLFRALVVRAKGDFKSARFGIAFTDEWDKKATRYGREGHDVTTLSIQQEFLVPMQGAEFAISGKRAMERPVMFDSRGTFFAFAGAFNGLSELIRKKSNLSRIGFSAPSGSKTRQQQYILDGIRDYGYCREWVNRLTSVMFLPDPTLASLGKAAANGILDSFNALLGELDVVLFPEPIAVPRMVEYALQSRTFYRGVRSIWWSIAEAVVASGAKGIQVITPKDVEEAIGRVASGSAGVVKGQGKSAEAQTECNADEGDGHAISNG